MSFLCAIPVVASLVSACAAPAPLAVGYVEGEYVLLAPTETAQVLSVKVRRGDRVEAGEAVAVMERRDAEIAVDQAAAALAQAKAQLADLQQGKRPEEIDVLQADLVKAEADKAEAERELRRTEGLFERGIATQAQYDKAKTSLTLARAEVGQARANLAVAKLPARPEEIEAARYRLEGAKAELEQARWRLSERVVEAPADGRIDDVIRNPGDLAGPSAPVISMLPDGAIKLKVYVPEEAFSSIKVGDVLSVRCDGCGAGLTARISYISPDPEFTPPVIYSLEARQKLVYLVEAKPVGDAGGLQPGQIVDVLLARDES
jgi:HlyD family secretion protein